MARLSFVWIIHTTSTRADADTDDAFRLSVRASPFPLPPGTWVRVGFPDLPSPDERERGATEQYRFDFRSREPAIDMALLDGADMEIEILGSDAWLPSSIWAIGQDVNGTRKLIAAHPSWPTSISNGWFSTDLSEGRPTRRLG
jgi:hypothetical protein